MLFDFFCPETSLQEGLSGFKPSLNFQIPADLVRDKFIASSALQKALRRKDLSQAMLAAAVLKEIDAAYLFRRLKVIALEDIGAADLELLSQVLWVCGKPDWMQRHGGADFVLAYILHRVCQTKALRTTDNLLYTASKSRLYTEQRRTFSGMTQSEFIHAFVDGGLDAVEQTLACWFLCGNRYRCDDLDLIKGDPVKVLELCNLLNIPPFVSDVLKLSRSQEFFVSLLPAWLQLEQTKQTKVISESNQPSQLVGWWASESLDRHTIQGKRAFSLFLRSTPQVSQFIEKHLPKSNPVDVIGWVVFILEGQLLNNRILYSEDQDLQDKAEAAWMGIYEESLRQDIMGMVQENMEGLYEARILVTTSMATNALSADGTL